MHFGRLGLGLARSWRGGRLIWRGRKRRSFGRKVRRLQRSGLLFSLAGIFFPPLQPITHPFAHVWLVTQWQDKGQCKCVEKLRCGLIYNYCLENKSHPLRGYIYIASATFLWGIAAALGRAAFTGHPLPGGQVLRPIDPLILSQTRTTFSFLVFLPVLGFWRGWKRVWLPPKDALQTLLIGVFGVAASNYFYYLAIQRTNVATAIILQYTAPIWVLLYAVFRGIQKATWQRISGVALALTGIALVIGIVGSGFKLDRIGVIAALLAAFSFTFYNIGAHSILARYDRWIVLLHTTGSASLFWILVNSPWKIAAANYSAAQWLFLLFFSLLSVLAAFSFYFAGLQHLEPTRAVVVSCLEPVFSIVLAAILLGEVLQPLQGLGIILVLAAIVVVQMAERQKVADMPIIEPVD
jgi:DME family drug/metabolite transporter